MTLRARRRTSPIDPADLGELAALQGVVKFPVRIKCATLSWNTLSQGLDEVAQKLPPSRAPEPSPVRRLNRGVNRWVERSVPGADVVGVLGDDATMPARCRGYYDRHRHRHCRRRRAAA